MEGSRSRFMWGGLAFLCAAVSLSSCATVSGKFTPTMKENVGIFADQTVALLSQADFGFTRSETIYTRPFWDEEGEEEKNLVRSLDLAKESFRGIIDYSYEIVLIAETKDAEKEKVEAYADFISDFDDKLLEDLRYSRDHYVDLIREVREQESFLDALKKAQPIINAAGKYNNRVLDDMVESMDVVMLKMEDRIDTEYREVIRYQEILEDEKYAAFQALEQLYLTHKGDRDAFGRFIESGVLRSKKLLPEGPPSEEDLIRLNQTVLGQLDNINRVWMEISQDWENYRATHRELDELHAKMLENINRARMVTLLWTRAHQKMAHGVLAPAEWFDIKDLVGIGTKFF